jgi:ribosome-associated protein
MGRSVAAYATAHFGSGLAQRALLDWGQVKKPRRAALSKRKVQRKQGGSRPQAVLKGSKGSKGSSGSARIPVRGAKRSQVKQRPPVGATPRAQRSEAELADTRALAIVAMEAALDKRALEPVLIDVSAIGSYTDFIGIVSGRSDRQVDAIAEGVSQALKARGLYPLGQEGSGSGRWTLLDFGAFVIHVFYHPVREFYDLESLWIEAPRVKLDVPPEAILQQPDALYGAL